MIAYRTNGGDHRTSAGTHTYAQKEFRPKPHPNGLES